MSETSPILALPYILPAQAQKHVTHNEALLILDVAVQLAVLSRSETSAPASPALGDRYLVAATGTGDWAGQDNNIALWNGSIWTFHTPVLGWRAYVFQDSTTLLFDGTGWVAEQDSSSVDLLGINTQADSVNRLAVAGDATLLTHDGSGHQLKINKALETDTNSLLFQTGFAGRAEMGCAGSDDFSVKVSADGANWVSALTVDAASGIVSGDAVQNSPDDVAPGKLARADYVYGPATLLGPVSETGGVPTGAVIERGSTPTGTYVRWADGTQICLHRETLAFNATAAGAVFRDIALPNWVFPAAFTSAPVVSFQPDGSNWGSADPNQTESTLILFRHNAISGNVQCSMMAVGSWL